LTLDCGLKSNEVDELRSDVVQCFKVPLGEARDYSLGGNVNRNVWPVAAPRTSGLRPELGQNGLGRKMFYRLRRASARWRLKYTAEEYH